MSLLDVDNSIAPWVLSAFLLVFLALFTLTIRTLREARRAPYFFQRRQAQQQLQTYSLASLVMLIATLGVAVYAWQPADNSAPRLALLTNAKPASANLTVLESRPESSADIAATEASVEVASATPLLLELPASYNSLTPTVALIDTTQLGPLAFATTITDQYEPIGARRTFGEGFFTLYATFPYQDMSDGMVWSWVWRRNGEVIGGGHETWNYGEEGPGYIYLKPEAGFKPGEYSLEIWINGELLTQDSVNISARAANN